jgi:two-component system response regulator RegA
MELEVRMNPSTEIPRMLLVDDDPSFRKVLAKIASRFNLALTPCESLNELGELQNWSFDVALIDCHLRASSGIDLVRKLEHVYHDLPVLLISETENAAGVEEPLPSSIKNFCPKSEGLKEMLIAALAVARKPPGGSTRRR